MDEHYSWYNGSVWHISSIYRSVTLYFMAHLFCFILKTIWWRNVLGIMDQCDSKINFVEYMWVSDQYFMVHWFCLISSPIHARSPGGGKISWYSTDLVLRRGCWSHGFWNKSIFFSGTFGSFWDVVAENKPILWEGMIWQANFMGGYDLNSLTCLKINTFSSAILLIEAFSKWNSRLYANIN